jgi:hypothetical protein
VWSVRGSTTPHKNVSKPSICNRTGSHALVPSAAVTTHALFHLFRACISATDRKFLRAYSAIGSLSFKASVTADGDGCGVFSIVINAWTSMLKLQFSVWFEYCTPPNCLATQPSACSQLGCVHHMLMQHELFSNRDICAVCIVISCEVSVLGG